MKSYEIVGNRIIIYDSKIMTTRYDCTIDDIGMMYIQLSSGDRYDHNYTNLTEIEIPGNMILKVKSMCITKDNVLQLNFKLPERNMEVD